MWQTMEAKTACIASTQLEVHLLHWEELAVYTLWCKGIWKHEVRHYRIADEGQFHHLGKITQLLHLTKVLDGSKRI